MLASNVYVMLCLYHFKCYTKDTVLVCSGIEFQNEVSENIKQELFIKQ